MLTQFAQYYMMDGGDWGWGLLMMFVWILLIVLVVVLLFRGTGVLHGNNHTPGEDALAVAKRRYANGEITKEQFDQLKKDLS